jgi:hypothetical protein
MSDMFFANYLLSSITLTDGGEATGSCYQLEKLLDCFPSLIYFSSFRNWIGKKHIVNTEVLDYIHVQGLTKLYSKNDPTKTFFYLNLKNVGFFFCIYFNNYFN